MIEIWMGTPNEMAKATTAKKTQPAAISWVRDHLDELKKQARKYDNAAIDGIQSVSDELGKTTVISKGDVRAWEFTYMGITVRIELRNP